MMVDRPEAGTCGGESSRVVDRGEKCKMCVRSSGSRETVFMLIALESF